MAKGKRDEKEDDRVATTLRMTSDEADLVGRLRDLRGLQTQQPVVHSAFRRGLHAELAEEGMRLYRDGMTLSESAKRVGLPYGELFDYAVEQRVTLIDDPSFLEHTAELARRLGLPSLVQAAEKVLAETLEPA